MLRRRLQDAQKRFDRMDGKTRPSRNITAQAGDVFDAWDDLRAVMVTAFDPVNRMYGTEKVIGLSESLLAATEN